MLLKTIYRFRFQLILLILWCLIGIIVNPLGEFAINDDWAYAHNTKSLAEDGVVTFSFWPAMTLICQTMWGLLFSKLFGYSLLTLRMATLVLAMGTTLIFFSSLKRESKNELIAFGITLVLIGSPMFMSLSFSYMTEIYYLFFGGTSFLFFARFFRNERLLDWFFAIVFVILTVLVRQTGMIFPIGFGIVYLLAKRLNWKRVLLAVLPLVIAYLSLDIYIEWRNPFGIGSLSRPDDLFRSISELPLEYYINRIGVLFHVLGFALIPVVLLIFSRLKIALTLGQWIRMALFLVPIMYCMLSAWSNFPAFNVFQDFELGPRLLKDVTLFGENLPEPRPDWIWSVVRCLNVITISVLFYALFTISTVQNGKIRELFGITKSIGKRPFLYMMILIFGAQSVYIIINPIFFDRYVLPMAFTGLILVALLFNGISTRQRYVFFGVASVFLVMSMLLSRDLMSWHRARLEATNFLEIDNGIPKSKIDGGMEFNSYYKTADMNPYPNKTTDKSWWFVKEDDFLITCGELAGYQKWKSFPTHQTISTGRDSIYILKRIVIELDSSPD